MPIKKIETLSKGMAQKVQFTAAVLHEPRFIVLDEPFTGLDPVSQDQFKKKRSAPWPMRAQPFFYQATR